MFMARAASSCPMLSCNSRAICRLSSSRICCSRLESSRRFSVARFKSAVRSLTFCSSSLCAFRNCSSAHLLFAIERRFASPRAMMRLEKTRNPSIPETAILGSSRAKEPAGGRNQYQTPSNESRVVTMEGPSPQYQAEKTTAAQTV
jgi:hypothetical protein